MAVPDALGRVPTANLPAKISCDRSMRRDPLELWAGDPAIALPDIVEEIKTEIRLLRLAETERARHERARDQLQTVPRGPCNRVVVRLQCRPE